MWTLEKGKDSETCNKRKTEVSSKSCFSKGLDWKGLALGLYSEIKFIRSGIYVGDRIEKYFIYVNNLKLIKTIFKL